MNNSKCPDCGKPMQYCECKFDKIVNLVNGLIIGNGETLILKTQMTLSSNDVHFIVKEARVVPTTLQEYFDEFDGVYLE